MSSVLREVTSIVICFFLAERCAAYHNWLLTDLPMWHEYADQCI